MGVSTDAIIFYGYCWSEEGVELYEGDKGWEEVVLAKRGVVNPWAAYPDAIRQIGNYAERRKAEDAWSAEHRAELDKWYEAKRAVKAEFGCDIGRHCSGDYSMPYVFAEGSETAARRGYPVEISAADVTAQDGWAAKLDTFMATIGISKPDGQDSPRWWLVSYWG